MLRPIRRLLLGEANDRLNDLETAVEVLLDSPSWAEGEGVGFNGLAGRKRVFADLLAAFPFDRIIETGTYLGNTTGYMARASGLPVLSCEVNRTLHLLARMRLKGMASVELAHSDSRAFIRGVAQRPALTGEATFFYLDAHWGSDCPLREEIDLIASRWERFIVMVDDFRVEGDEGYGYDRYGLFTRLDLAFIRPELGKHRLRSFFPSLPSGGESAQPRPRGCVVLAPGSDWSRPLGGIASLREWGGGRNP